MNDITSETLRANRALKARAVVLAHNGNPFTVTSIGGAIATRAIIADLRGDGRAAGREWRRAGAVWEAGSVAVPAGAGCGGGEGEAAAWTRDILIRNLIWVDVVAAHCRLYFTPTPAKFTTNTIKFVASSKKIGSFLLCQRGNVFRRTKKFTD